MRRDSFADKLRRFAANGKEVTADYLASLNISVEVTHLPGRLHGQSIKCINGYKVFINESLSEDARWRTFIHELGHIVRMDFDRTDAVEIIEVEADG